MTYHKTVRPSCTHTFIFVHSGSYIFIIQIKDVVFFNLDSRARLFFSFVFLFSCYTFLEIFASSRHVIFEA